MIIEYGLKQGSAKGCNPWRQIEGCGMKLCIVCMMAMYFFPINCKNKYGCGKGR